MRDRPRAALGDPLPVFPESCCSDGGLVWVSVGNGLGRVSSHGNKGSACYRRRPGTAPRGALVLVVLDALKAAEVDDRIRQAAQTIYQALIEAELSSVIGALPHELSGSRTGHRN